MARYLIAQGGKPKFVSFVGQGLNSGNWGAAVQVHYGYESLGDLQLDWVDWVSQGSRENQIATRDIIRPDVQLALATDAGSTRDNLDSSPAPLTPEPVGPIPPRGRRPQVDPELLASRDSDPTLDRYAAADTGRKVPPADDRLAEHLRAQLVCASPTDFGITRLQSLATPAAASVQHANTTTVGASAPRTADPSQGWRCETPPNEQRLATRSPDDATTRDEVRLMCRFTPAW